MDKGNPDYLISVGLLYGCPIHVRCYHATKQYHCSLKELREALPQLSEIEFENVVSNLRKLPRLKGLIFDKNWNSPKLDEIYSLNLN